MSPRSRQGGFTLVEVMVTAAVLVVMLVGLGSTADIAGNSMRVNERRSEACERVQRFLQRIAQFSRSGVLSTYQVEATAADIAAGRAAAVGDWIDPIDGERRPVVRFRAADGILAMNAGSLTDPIELRFQPDEGEDPLRNPGAAAGRDDDRDGLIDDGQVQIDYQGVSAGLLRGVASCWFVLDGSLLTVQVQTARRVAGGPQFHFEQGFVLRNN